MQEEEVAAAKPAQSAAGHISNSAASFRDFLLKSEILKAINDCAFEHPSKGTVPQDRETYPHNRPHQVSCWQLSSFTLRRVRRCHFTWAEGEGDTGGARNLRDAAEPARNCSHSCSPVVQGQTCWSGGLVPQCQWQS